LIEDGAAVEAWLVEATSRLLVHSSLENGKSVPAAQSLAWSAIPALVYIPKIREDARRTAEALHPIFPRATTVRALYGEVWRGLAAGKMRDISMILHPALGSLPEQEAERAALQVCNRVLVTLLQVALLEEEAAVEESLGEQALVFRLGEERVSPGEIALRFLRDPREGYAEFERWALRLAPA
jgi:hypothetical protein